MKGNRSLFTEDIEGCKPKGHFEHNSRSLFTEDIEGFEKI